MYLKFSGRFFILTRSCYFEKLILTQGVTDVMKKKFGY